MRNKANYFSIIAKKTAMFLPLFAIVALHPEQAHAANFLDGIFDTALSSVKNLGVSVINGLNSVVNGALSQVGSFFDSIGLGGVWNKIMNWLTGTGTCGQKTAKGVGTVMCNVVISTQLLPGLISGIAYLSGILLSVTAMLKLKEHVLNPDRAPLSDSMKRFVAGGAFFSLPSITNAVQTLLIGSNEEVSSYQQSGGFAGSVNSSGGLDSMITRLVADIWEPLQILLASFSYLAGLVFVVIGIGRLIKTSQDGPRGPSGMGTIMTFVTAGVLFSLDNLMGAFSSSMFATNNVATYAVLNSQTGDTTVDAHIVGVISAVTAFMALVGWISFIRGFFILRDVAEGNGQASLMAATTHMFGGALAVNLGPLINAVQSTFGLTPYGVSFTT